jgi:hypothetical protein
MNSFQETQRRFNRRHRYPHRGCRRVIGFRVLEGISPGQRWLTVITLATIGYGDVYAKTEAGRVSPSC